MNICQAMQAMKEDGTRRFRRAGWQRGASIRLAPIAPVLGPGEMLDCWALFLGFRLTPGIELKYLPAHDDIEAIDWELAT